MSRADHVEAAASAEASASCSLVSGPLDQAYREFCARRDRGEAIDADRFCAEFPALQSRLGRLLQAHLFLENHPDLLADPSDVRWPECGQVFLDFELMLELGHGAFARVFLAREPKLGGRLVALKIAWHGGAEAEVLGRLQHPNIVPVHSVHAEPNSDLAAVCMPYLGSATLRDVIDKLREKPTPPTDARFLLEACGPPAHPLDPSAHLVRADPILLAGTFADGVRVIAAQLADALAFLHARGTIHQDLKPSNVLMTPAGTPMLLDFNLSADARTSALLGGTLPYMAPELLRGQEEASPALIADARSDIFSLGVMLFELATGRHPFGPIPPKAKTPELRGMLLERMRQETPNPCALNAGIEKSLGQSIQRCLAWDPQERPESADIIAQALRQELRPAARVRRWLGRRPKMVAVSLCLCAILGIAAAAFDAARPPLAKRQYDAGVALHNQCRFKEAIAQFSAILDASPQNADALMARARAFQEWGRIDVNQYPSALADYRQAHRLAPDGRAKAAIGYCLNQTGADPRAAILSYQEARELRFEAAALFNNLGCCQLKTSQIADAEASLDRAIALDPRLQAAYHNRASVHLQKALALAHVPAKERRRDALSKIVQAGLADIARAIELGPLSAELYFDAARLHGLAARDDPAQKKAALDCLQEAVAGNFDPRQLAHDPCFAALAEDAAFGKLQKTPPPEKAPARAVRIVDPLVP